MPTILPTTDLRNNFSEIERLAKESREPIYLTKNGRGTLVLMDIDAFEDYQNERAYHRFVENALDRASKNAASGASRYHSFESAFETLLTESPESAGNREDADATA